MILRPFVFAQPKPQLDRKPLAPSLLSDPAFSADPLSHPLSFTNHGPWLFTPPLGHPPLHKSRAAARNPILAFHEKTIDSDTEPFHLIQPPNSPVNFHDQTDSPTFIGSDDVPDTEDAPLDVSLSSTSSWTALSSLKTRSAESISTVVGEVPSLFLDSPPSSHCPLSPQPLPTPQASKAKPEYNYFMTFLSRRKPAQKLDAPATAPPKLSKAMTLPPRRPPPSAEDDVTRPARVPRFKPTEHHQVDAPVMAARSNTIGSVVATPASSSSTLIGSFTAKRQDGPQNRMKDLDRIDELDETNPWGISLHHNGPYEAATQALRHPERTMPLGFGNSDYHQRAMQAHGNNYVPPQAPVGGSLNLSPGQILPRNFAAQYGQATQAQAQPVIRDTVPPPTAAMMLPPQRNSYIPSVTRRSTYQPDSATPVQASTSLPVTSNRQSIHPPVKPPMTDFHPLPTTTSHSLPSRRQSHMGSSTMTPLPNQHNPLPPQSHRHRPPPPTSSFPLPSPPTAPAPPSPPNRDYLPPSNPQPQQSSRSSPNGGRQMPINQMDLASIGIGMAMLGSDSEDEDSEPPTPEPAPRRVSFTQPPTERRDDSPYGGSQLSGTPPHTDIGRRMGSMPDIEEEDFFLGVNPSGRKSEEAISGGFDYFGSPPPYTPSEIRRKSITPPPEPAATRQHSITPPPQPPQVNPNARRDLSRISEEHGSSSWNHSSQDALRAPRPPPVPMPQTTPAPLATQNSPNATGQQSLPQQASPPRRSYERALGPGSISDGRSSTQPSSNSSYASSQSRMGPPPPRHLPKRLVMPAPLSQSVVSSPNMNIQRMSLPPTRSPPRSPHYGQFHHPVSSQQGYAPSRHTMPPPGIMSPPSAMAPLPPQQQMQMRPRPPSGPPPTTYRPRPAMPMQPVHNIVKVQAQEIQFAPSKGSKLKKRVSMISTNPSSGPVTTVSFAPPIIGFDRSVVVNDKNFQRAMSEKVGSTMGGNGAPKRLLSKRR